MVSEISETIYVTDLLFHPLLANADNMAPLDLFPFCMCESGLYDTTFQHKANSYNQLPNIW